MDKSRYFTRQKANAGFKMFLPDPVTGKNTEDWLQVLGADSDVARKGDIAVQRELSKLYADAFAETDDKVKARELVQKAKEATAAEDLIKEAASLVVGWGFGDFSTENVLAFLTEAPYIADMVVTKSKDRANFFGDEASSSSPTQKPTSDSANP
jgi:hypothetical protein